MLTQDQKREMEEFMRPVSPLVSYAKSLRMEEKKEGGSPGSGGPSADDAQKIIDHFEGIDIDELPENVRGAIAKARETITTTTAAAQTAETRRTQAEQFARKQQSDADRLRGVLQHHNLGNGSPTNQPPNLEGDKLAARVQRFIDKGLKPEAAKVYAEMFQEESAIQEREILARVSPLAGAVGSVQAQQVLGEFETSHANLFAIPEVAKQVRDNVAVMVQQGNTVNSASVNHLLEMAFGAYAMKNPGEVSKLNSAAAAVPNFSGGGGMNTGGGHRSNANLPADGKPVATQPETSTIIAAINAQMIRDLPTKAKK